VRLSGQSRPNRKGEAMKRMIAVEIDPDGDYCLDCPFVTRQYGCSIFGEDNFPEGMRNPLCADAEANLTRLVEALKNYLHITRKNSYQDQELKDALSAFKPGEKEEVHHGE
jgi:hypothetical protein